MPNHVQLKAEKREVRGKKVGRLRRSGVLPAVVYDYSRNSEPVQVDAHDFRLVMRQTGRTQLIDLAIEGDPVRPVVIRQTGYDPKRNTITHVEFYQPNLMVSTTTNVPLAFVGESPAAKAGGIFIPVLDHVTVESLPEDVPVSIEVDVTRMTEDNRVLHVSDLPVPANVTLLTPEDEVVAKIDEPLTEAAVEESLAPEPLPEELGGEGQPEAEAVPEA